MPPCDLQFRVCPQANRWRTCAKANFSWRRKTINFKRGDDTLSSMTKLLFFMILCTYFLFTSIITERRMLEATISQRQVRALSVWSQNDGLTPHWRPSRVITTDSITPGMPQKLPLLQENATASKPPKTNFSGVVARAFQPWPSGQPLPCFPAEKNWQDMNVQFTPANEGLFYLKPYKTGSSTASGVHIRISRNIARRRPYLKLDMCKTRFDHGPNYAPATTLYKDRNTARSILWTILREPTARAISMFFHFEVSRRKLEPSDRNFKEFLSQGLIQDYYLRALYPHESFFRTSLDPVFAANYILKSYDFIGIMERLDESLVVLMMQLNLKMADILYLSAKGRGGYDAAGGPTKTCTYIWPSFVSPAMQEHFASDEWQNYITYDTLLYQAVNRSLDMTIDKLGRDSFNEKIAKFKHAQSIALTRCLPTAVFPCDARGEYNSKTDCLWKDSGCGATCLDEVATELNLW